MHIQIKLILAALLLVMVVSPVVSADNKPTVDQVSHELTCMCGTCPNLALYSCSCGTADKMRSEVGALIEKGMDSDDIVESFIENYGARVLAAPKAEGFYLTAWVLPIFAVLGFGIFLLFALKKWSNSRLVQVEEDKYSSVKIDDRYNDQLENELNNF